MRVFGRDRHDAGGLELTKVGQAETGVIEPGFIDYILRGAESSQIAVIYISLKCQLMAGLKTG
jgi:hypothetical protein